METLTNTDKSNFFFTTVIHLYNPFVKKGTVKQGVILFVKKQLRQ